MVAHAGGAGAANGLYKYHEGKLVVDPRSGEAVFATGNAASMQVQAAIAALPYLHQKQPMAIEASGQVEGLIVVGEFKGQQSAGDGMLTLDMQAIQQHQRVIDAQPQQSDALKSDTQHKQKVSDESN